MKKQMSAVRTEARLMTTVAVLRHFGLGFLNHAIMRRAVKGDGKLWEMKNSFGRRLGTVSTGLKAKPKSATIRTYNSNVSEPGRRSPHAFLQNGPVGEFENLRVMGASEVFLCCRFRLHFATKLPGHIVPIEVGAGHK
jgi:hypothetical protein